MTTKLVSNISATTRDFGLSDTALGAAGEVGAILTVGTEDMAVIAGQGTANVTVDRGANGTFPVPHAAGDTVTAGSNAVAAPALNVTAFKIGGTAATVAATTALTIQTLEATFTETAGAGTYTATFAIPAGATVRDVVVRNTAVWTNAGTAALTVGDGDSATGYFTSTDVKTVPAADTNGAGAGLSTQLSLGASAGAYKGGGGKFCAAAKTITATITTSSTGGGAGRTRVLVVYAVPVVAAATKG